MEFFKSLYYYLDWSVNIESLTIESNSGAFSRIVYNLLSNSCKYNVRGGFIRVYSGEGSLTIQNSSYGIREPSKIFNRFYKEGDRGLGMGLHIVDKLSRELNITLNLSVDSENIVTVTLKF
ncbi:MAG: ATP-binding protein [Epsilonproteobacteria bacterium]|nr:ATP-binding protein [Campylobacterota bacterium]